MLVKDVMTSDYHVATPQTTLREAAQMMRDGDFGFLPVAQTDRLTGAVTDRDIVVRGLAGSATGDTPLSDVLSVDIVYCLEDDEISEAADLMMREQIRRLAVLNDQKRLVGVVTVGDIARAVENTRIAGDIEAEVAKV